jgi:hypothetical protein
MFRSWRTSLLGGGAVLTAAGHLLTNLASGDFSSVPVDGMAIMTGLGLLFAKDHKVGGSAP